MNIEENLQYIKDNWKNLNPGKINGYDWNDTPVAVWFANTDHAAEYEVDEEWIGMKEDGTLVWTYASGCSCWNGNYETKDIGCDTKSVKVFEFSHEDMKEGWEKQLEEFVKKHESKR